MEKSTDIETKYQKLATEFSKVRSQATVLKKAVLDEQAKNTQLNEVLKTYEQTIRKHDQEMESLIFRNEQLTKRIFVLQQELQGNNHSKKSKSNTRAAENVVSSDIGVLNEELQKKILENAQLSSSMADKDLELIESKEKIQWLEENVASLNRKFDEVDLRHKNELLKLSRDKIKVDTSEKSVPNGVNTNNCDVNNEQLKYWKEEAERWKTDCLQLRSKPDSNEKLTDYYEKQIKEILDTKTVAQSETKSLWAENLALKSRLENVTLEHGKVANNLEKSYEELTTTNESYKAQLDAMNEHFLAQNEKITKQCDEIQLLKHLLSTKK